MEQEKKLRFHMKLRLYYEERNFGPGVAGLMQLVRERGSLAAACQEMHMAYSKAWKIIHKAEEDLGFPLMEGKQRRRERRRHGSDRRGRSVFKQGICSL